MSEKEIQKAKEIRNTKDRERYAADEKTRLQKQYVNQRSTARNFLLKKIKEEDKEEFRNILKKL